MYMFCSRVSRRFRRLASETRKFFKERTPPTIYIDAEDTHSERPAS
jgi:hypothetical protein